LETCLALHGLQSRSERHREREYECACVCVSVRVSVCVCVCGLSHDVVHVFDIACVQSRSGRVMTHVRMSHVTRMNQSCHTYESVMSHI